ncbi:MAG TPA: hypothetical protein VMT86_17225 [Bryobacteraceae bacterium]|nr:hypothetical protein [Bryobacteraceae bacterium]
MSFDGDCHATDDQLESYSLGRLAGFELQQFEEHLLVCNACQDRLAREDAIADGMRSAARALESQPVTTRRMSPKLLWAYGLAAAALLAVIVAPRALTRHPAVQPALVVLQANRGPESVTAAARTALTLALDLTDLRSFPEYRIEVVDANGRPVFQAKAAPANNSLRVTLADGLSRGAYFVRLYSPAQELLREYSLTCP